jgi:hemolysin activation/secretion protein
MTWFNPNDIADLLNLVAVHTQGSDYARLAYSVPVGVDGWRMGANVSVMKYEVVVGEKGVVGAFGKAVTQGLEWLYPLIRKDNSSATVALTADLKEFKNYSFTGDLNNDYQSKVLAAQVSGFYRDPNPGGGVGTYSVQLNHGELLLDGSTTMQRSMDKAGPKTDGPFNKLKVTGTWQQPLSTQTSAFVSYTGQLADKNLDSSEKMQLGGMNGVRAYPTGEGSGADGQLVQLELRHTLDSGVTLTGFYDWGMVWQYHDTSFGGSPKHNDLIYKGFGFSLGYTFNNGANVKATFARRDGDNPNPTQNGNDQDGTRDRNRYWLQLNLPF